jgi:nitrogen fixation/metabolism regulation signal transduction histidine kinase
MSLRTRLGAYLVLLHAALFALAALLLHERAVWFVAVELLLLASLAGGFHLLRQALEPLGYTQRLHDLLQDQHYAHRLATPKAGELEELVTLFNTLLATLHRERLEIGEQQGFLDRLLEATPSAVIVFDFDGRISLLNASAQSLHGLAEARGKTLAECVQAGDSLLAQLDALPLGDSQLLADADGRRYRGQRGQFYDRGFARHFLLVEELTEELESSERATYEKLIRVLAHEVNNTVAATGSVLDSLLYYRSQLAERDSEDFSTAILAVQRRNASLGEFIERFTRVVKMPAPELRPAAIRDIMDDILYLYREQCRSRGISIAWERCDAVPLIAMDRQLMEQALLNVVKNAMEAVEMGASDDKRIAFVLAREDGAVRLSVIDSGNLLGEVPAHQLFTPFFTTKKGGQGIGLLFVREVLNRHGFHYRLAATGKRATAFDIWL